MTNGRKPTLEVGIQMPEAKIAAESATMSGPLVPVSSGPDWKFRRKSDAAYVLLRLLCLISSTAALSFMVSAEQSATISVYGFELPISSRWSYSDSFDWMIAIFHSSCAAFGAVWIEMHACHVCCGRDTAT